MDERCDQDIADGLKTDEFDCKEFATRTRGQLIFDTEQNPEKPRGKAQIRLIVVATFFLKPGI
jgi:hypothetical protein